MYEKTILLVVGLVVGSGLSLGGWWLGRGVKQGEDIATFKKMIESNPPLPERVATLEQKAKNYGYVLKTMNDAIIEIRDKVFALYNKFIEQK